MMAQSNSRRVWNPHVFIVAFKQCLKPCPGLSMYFSEMINWIISSFPHRISKILFVLGRLGDFETLECRIGEEPFFYVLIFLIGNVTQQWEIWIFEFLAKMWNRNKLWTSPKWTFEFTDLNLALVVVAVTFNIVRVVMLVVVVVPVVVVDISEFGCW